MVAPVLDDDVPDDVGRGLAGVDRILERLEDVLPADHLDGIHMVLEEAGDRLRRRLSAASSSASHGRGGARRCAGRARGPCERCSAASTRSPHCWSDLHRTADLVEREEVGRVLDEVDDVVDRLRELVDVLPVERGDVLRVQELDDLAVRSSPLFSSSLTCAWRTSNAPARVRRPGARPRARFGGGEQVVELRGPRTSDNLMRAEP